jgi:hypothetical protein
LQQQKEKARKLGMLYLLSFAFASRNTTAAAAAAAVVQRWRPTDAAVVASLQYGKHQVAFWCCVIRHPRVDVLIEFSHRFLRKFLVLLFARETTIQLPALLESVNTRCVNVERYVQRRVQLDERKECDDHRFQCN